LGCGGRRSASLEPAAAIQGKIDVQEAQAMKSPAGAQVGLAIPQDLGLTFLQTV